MRCSVVIPCHNGAELTRACLVSLLAQDDGPPAEILLVDNASTDATGTLADLHPSVRVLHQPENRGFAGGVNVGLRAAREPWVLVLNNDTQAATNLLRELGRALDHDPRIAAAAPTSNHVKGPARLAVGNRGRQAGQRAELAAELGEEPIALQDVDTLAGLCMLLRRETLDEIGLFDERFGHGNFEDDDLCLRLRLAGHRLVIARRAFLHHEGHATFQAMGLDLREQITRRHAQFVAKWRTDPAGRAVIAAMQCDLAGATEAATIALNIWPQWPDADWHLARWQAARGDHAAAARHFTALLRRCPYHTEAAIELGLCLLALDERAGQAQLARALQTCYCSAAAQATLLERLGERAYHAGRTVAATADFEAALQLTPQSGSLHNWLGLCRLAEGLHEAAAAAFTQAAEHGFALAHNNLGVCLHHLGDVAAAATSFAKACELLPHDASAKANLARCAAPTGIR